MNSIAPSEIIIKGARTNNLKNISLRIPHNKFIVVSGVSGSGKSSLISEIIAKEGQRRYFETLPSFARQFLGKLKRPDVDEIEGLSPVIFIGQQTAGMHARSTVGTISDIYDLLRLLFARTGTVTNNVELSRALFSFNSEVGKCKRCNGIGKEEQIDLNSLITFPKRTIREGALAPTLPNGYIMYSQVTIDVLNHLCNSEGFNVDIPWNELTKKQQDVILYGSTKIKVPFGKHSLESRLKWTGIKAKPREEGYYKGMIPIMSDILKRDRNANILKYVHAVTCADCNGNRLNKTALNVCVHGKSIAEIVTLELTELKSWIKTNSWSDIATEIIKKIESQVILLEDLGLGYLTIDRSTFSLRSSEIQRIRVANQMLTPLSNVLYIFDEPSIGLHKEENEKLIYHFKQLVKKGNTVIVVEHNLNTITSADHIIELGPKAGINGGELVFNGPFLEFIKQKTLNGVSPTFRAVNKNYLQVGSKKKTRTDFMHLMGCYERNLKYIDVKLQLGKLNVVSGKSGSGKASLVKETLIKVIEGKLGNKSQKLPKLESYKNIDSIDKLVYIDHTPIGKTPRSNPATYLGLSDHIRDIYAKQPESKLLGFTKSRFSFNNKGGRCEVCQGAGKTQIGMHFLGTIDLICGTCNGDRFNKETLQVTYNGLSIADIYRLSVNDALKFFVGHKKITQGLETLKEIGLGYLTLGHSSTTLSGGEAQRIKIANQLQKKDTGNTLYVIIEPSIGLHQDDIESLLNLFKAIQNKGNTIVCVEQNQTIIRVSDWHIELGPIGGVNGGNILHQGIPNRNEESRYKTINNQIEKTVISNDIVLKGVTTNGLKNIDVRIPKNQLTVVTGVSGSGKSSLVYDTLFAESNARFTESLSTYNRSFLKQNSNAELESFSGLGPAIGVNRRGGATRKRSTVGTLSGIYDAFRLLYSRIAQYENKIFTAQHFSFNHHLGACQSCEGIGVKLKCNPDEIIVFPEKSIFEGAISTNKVIAYYSDVNGQHMAILNEVAKQNKWNLQLPWEDLDPEIKNVILYGTGEEVWSLTWSFKTKSRSGTQKLNAKWLGLCNYIDNEFQRKIHNKNKKNLEDLLHEVECYTCKGSRLKNELLDIKFLGKNIYEISKQSMVSCYELIEGIPSNLDKVILEISKVVLPTVKESLRTIIDLGLGYLSLDRAVTTLSGGERQRITLAGQLSSHLYGVTYVLDEPTIGLDDKQVTVLSNVLKKIVANGNTVVVVEHDISFIKKADYIIEIGPGAGSFGGEIIYQGKVEGIKKAKQSITRRLFDLDENIVEKVYNDKGKPFEIKGAFANNLKNIDIKFYSGQVIALTGVSGSGKSSLIKEVLFNSWLKKKPINCYSLHGLNQFEDVLLIDQEILVQNRLGTPVVYTGIIDSLKKIYSSTELAKKEGLKKADFSYQSKKGKCGTCAGHGKVKTSMDFMSDIWLLCDTCKGLRYNDTILACKYKEHSIGEVLKMTVVEAIDFFKTEEIILKQLHILKKVGVGHIVLGQSGNTLSGGESQRLKLGVSMMQKKKGKTLYLFDEPSTGLHYFDNLQLISVFQSLINNGDTVLFIEHNKTLINSAYKVIKLGPGSGEKGGIVID
ncbi:hypothetical protein [Tenacibaculum halocynthiae]|uniref:hypothetical protein n=1 Tax=Tenacibaculum halocynthiae TaxID=1254437 RepID=UPI003D66165F